MRTLLLALVCVAGALAEAGPAAATETWVRQYPPPHARLASPPARAGASMAYDAQIGKVVLFGGRDPGGARNDTWTYDVATNTWKRQFPSTSPPARSSASMAYDAQSNLIVLFGGQNRTEQRPATPGPTTPPPTRGLP